MERSENRSKVERWLDLLDGGRTTVPGWVLVTAGCIFLGFMGFDTVAEQENPVGNLPILAQLLIGSLLVLRGAERASYTGRIRR